MEEPPDKNCGSDYEQTECLIADSCAALRFPTLVFGNLLAVGLDASFDHCAFPPGFAQDERRFTTDQYRVPNTRLWRIRPDAKTVYFGSPVVEQPCAPEGEDRAMTGSGARGSFKAAVVQAAPVAFDLERSLNKVHLLAADAAARGARLVLFPEAFLSGYPRGLDFGAVVGSRSEEGRADFLRYWESSVDVPGPAVDRLSVTARELDIYLVIGVVEREGGTLYCAVLFFAPDGT